MFPNRIYVVKSKNEVAEVLQTRSLLLNNSNLDFYTLLIGMKERMEAMTLFLSIGGRRLSMKRYGNPNP